MDTIKQIIKTEEYQKSIYEFKKINDKYGLYDNSKKGFLDIVDYMSGCWLIYRNPGDSSFHDCVVMEHRIVSAYNKLIDFDASMSSNGYNIQNVESKKNSPDEYKQILLGL